MESLQDQKLFDVEKASQEGAEQEQELVVIDPKAEARCAMPVFRLRILLTISSAS